jgi:predicted PurR-regulated permease PerM
VLELRSKLPVEIAVYLPEGAAEVQRVIANYLRAQAGSLAVAGRAWLHGILFSYVGLIVGGLAAVAHAPVRRLPLAEQLHQRVQTFGEAFGQIVAAQFWIAAFNTLLTAIFLLFVMPLWDAHLPYTPALITLTFLAGLVPIVGNLVCNSVITLVGLSVSPVTAAACLIFLIVIHKAEYVINAKVVGARTQMSVWELLAVMFVAEAVFGPAGLVAAPLYYAYLKKELQAARLV